MSRTPGRHRSQGTPTQTHTAGAARSVSKRRLRGGSVSVQKLTDLFQSAHLSYPRVKTKQDGPSLESSSYLNVSLRYLGPWDFGTLGPLVLGTLVPWDFWTFSLLQHLLILPLTYSYLLISLPPALLLWYGLVGGGRMG